MKKVILALFALLTALAISPVVSAQNYDFTYTSPENSATGWFTIAGPPSPGGNYATAGGLTWDSTSFSLVQNPGGGQQVLGGFYYDDLFFPDGAQGTYLDSNGLLFENAADTELLNIWSNGAGSYDSFWTWNGSTWVVEDNGGTFTPTVPEYGGLSMLILSALTLAGGFFIKAGQFGSFHVS